MSTFSFNSVSSDDMGLMVNTAIIPPSAESLFEETSIPSKAESLTKALQQKSNITITVQATILDNADIHSIYQKLSGKGTLTISTESGKYYKVVAVNPLVPESVAYQMSSVTIEFICKPFAYAVSNDAITQTVGTATAITNAGTVFCEPIYKIFGTGDGVLTVNGVDLTLIGIDGYITVDSGRRIAYKDSTVLVNKTAGKYPLLAVGTNYIAFSGGITKVEIIKNERYL